MGSLMKTYHYIHSCVKVSKSRLHCEPSPIGKHYDTVFLKTSSDEFGERALNRESMF